MKNKVSLIGRLGSDVKLKTFDNRKSVANFTIATSDNYKDGEGNKVEVTDWHNISVNGEFAKTCEKYIRKGSLVAIEGKIKTRDYEKDGTKVYITEVHASEVLFLDKKDA